MTAEWIGIRRRDPAALLLARRWSKVMALLFAVGAVSGTVLSYEMGLLWPGLMGRFGGAIGIPFSVEDVFFFLEAIFTGIYLYGWRRLAGWAHWWTGMPIVIAGIAGAMSVVAANSWMNQPAGFTLRHGKITAVNPWSVYFNRATPYEVPHMVLAAYMVTGFVIAGVYAVGMLRGRRNRYHELGFKIPSGSAPSWLLSRLWWAISRACRSPASSRRSSRRWSSSPTRSAGPPNTSAGSTTTVRFT
jgi:cytochrome d ubiquinol oxidase subunit I